MYSVIYSVTADSILLAMNMLHLQRRRSGFLPSYAVLLLLNLTLLLKSQNVECFHQLLPFSKITTSVSSSCPTIWTATWPQPTHSRHDDAGTARGRKRGRHHALFRMAERGGESGGDENYLTGMEKSAGVKLNKGEENNYLAQWQILVSTCRFMYDQTSCWLVRDH